jgi:hypothetical protein
MAEKNTADTSFCGCGSCCMAGHSPLLKYIAFAPFGSGFSIRFYHLTLGRKLPNRTKSAKAVNWKKFEVDPLPHFPSRNGIGA